MVIIGAGKAGARAAISLREHGWKGTITLIGEEAHAPYDRPPLSKAAMTAEDDPSPVFLLDDELLQALDVTFIARCRGDRYRSREEGRWCSPMAGAFPIRSC